MYREIKVLTTWSCIASMFAPTLATAQVAAPVSELPALGIFDTQFRACNPSDYVVAEPVIIEVPGGDGGVLIDVPWLESTLLSSEVLWDCAAVDGHTMSVTSQNGNIYTVHLLDNNDVASMEDDCASGPCDETLLDDFPNGSFISQEEELYVGYDELFLRRADPTITDSLCTIHKGIFTTPLGEQYLMVARIHRLSLTLENETLVTTEFLPMYIILEKDEAADVAASGALAESFNELVRFHIPGKRFGLDPNDLARESIWPPADLAGSDVGPRELSDEAKACIAAMKGCRRRARYNVQICKTRCSTRTVLEEGACASCWVLVWTHPALAVVCMGVCLGVAMYRERSCYKICWLESVRDTSDCGTAAQVCCILAPGGCGIPM